LIALLPRLVPTIWTPARVFIESPAMPEPSRNAIWFGAIALAAVGVMLAFELARHGLHN
jgi:hypothetical protein